MAVTYTSGVSKTTGVSRTNGLSPLGGVSDPLTGAATQTFLPTALGTPTMALGMRQLITAAPLAIQGMNASAVATDIGFDVTGAVSVAALNAASIVTANKWYDQSGNANHMINNGTNNRPTILPTKTFGNTVPIIFGGNDTQQPIITENLQTAATLAISRQAYSIYTVLAPRKSFYDNCHWQANTAGTGTLLAFTYNGTYGLQVNDTAVSTVTAGLVPRSNLSVNAYVGSAANRSIYLRETHADLAAGAAANFDQMMIGGAPAFGASFATCVDYLAMVIYPVAHTPAQAATVISALQTIFSVQTAANFTSRVVVSGDSIAEGTGAVLNTYEQINLPGAEIFNFGYFGITQATINTNSAAREQTMFTSAYGAGKCYAIQEAGTNDLAAGTTGAALYTLRTTWNTGMKGLGFHTIAADLIINNNLTAPQQTERTTFNVANLGNAASFNALATVGASLVTGNLYDGTHPTTAGHAILAPIYAAAVGVA